MIQLIDVEFYKLFRSYRTYISLGIVLVLMLLIDLGLYFDGQELFDFLLKSINEYFLLEGKLINGYLISYLALNTLWIHLPVLILIVTIHIFSGEFELGTVRALLTQPITRERLFFAKFFTTLFFVILFMTIAGLSSLLPSVLLFGIGDVVVFLDGIQFIQQGDYLLRFFGALLFAILGMMALVSIGTYFSLVFRSTLTAVLVTLGILIISTLLQTFVFGMMSWWQSFLFTFHMAKWQLFFVHEVPFYSIFSSILILMGIVVFFQILSYFKFQKMQITE